MRSKRNNGDYSIVVEAGKIVVAFEQEAFAWPRPQKKMRPPRLTSQYGYWRSLSSRKG